MWADRHGGRSRRALLAIQQDEAPCNDTTEPDGTDRDMSGLPLFKTRGVKEAIRRGNDTADQQSAAVLFCRSPATADVVAPRTISQTVPIRRILIRRLLKSRSWRQKSIVASNRNNRPVRTAVGCVHAGPYVLLWMSTGFAFNML